MSDTYNISQINEGSYKIVQIIDNNIAEALSYPVLSGTSLGNGVSVFAGKNGRNLEFKSLVAGNNISLSQNSSGITISSVASGGGNVYYTGATPSTITLGGINAGSTLTGKTFSTLFQELLVVYQSPVFGSFSFAGQSTLLEVGVGLSGLKTANWSTTNGVNISGNTISIRDVTSSTIILANTPNDGSQSVNIGTITNTSPISHSWRAEGVNTNSVAFQSSNFTISSLYPFFYGVANSRPTATNSLITGGTKVVSSSSGAINITFNATANYLWFAIPTSSGVKSSWFVSSLNNGSIGGAVSPGGNLFPDADSVTASTILWSNITYRIYISNYATTTTGSMQLS